MPDWARQLSQLLKTQQIIVVALSAGVVVFAGVALVLYVQGLVPMAGESPIVALSLLVVSLCELAARFVVPELFLRAARGRIARGEERSGETNRAGPLADFLREAGEPGKLFLVHQTYLILAATLIDGAALVAIMAFLLAGNWIGLALGLAMAAYLLTLFPTPRSVGGWIERQYQLLEQERDLAGPNDGTRE